MLPVDPLSYVAQTSDVDLFLKPYSKAFILDMQIVELLAALFEKQTIGRVLTAGSDSVIAIAGETKVSDVESSIAGEQSIPAAETAISTDLNSQVQDDIGTAKISELFTTDLVHTSETSAASGEGWELVSHNTTSPSTQSISEHASSTLESPVYEIISLSDSLVSPSIVSPSIVSPIGLGPLPAITSSSGIESDVKAEEKEVIVDTLGGNLPVANFEASTLGPDAGAESSAAAPAESAVDTKAAHAAPIEIGADTRAAAAALEQDEDYLPEDSSILEKRRLLKVLTTCATDQADTIAQEFTLLKSHALVNEDIADVVIKQIIDLGRLCIQDCDFGHVLMDVEPETDIDLGVLLARPSALFEQKVNVNVQRAVDHKRTYTIQALAFERRRRNAQSNPFS